MAPELWRQGARGRFHQRLFSPPSQKLEPKKSQLTRYGMDCYAYALLALGQIDLVVEAGLQPYDILAPIAVIEAAGGIVTDWQGGPATKGGRVLAAANTEIHAQALAILSQH
jgi:fructose-1,6-bisphosphatase/inositol monophosphatase family enzyme